MITIENLETYIHIVKELGETVMFSCFSYSAAFEFFETYLANYFLPIIAAMFIMNLMLEYYRFYKNTETQRQDMLRICFLTVSTLSIVAAIFLKLAKVHFTYGPHLFLFGIGVGIIANAITLVSHALLLLKQEKESDDYQHHLQAILKNLNTMVTKAVIFGTILTLFVISGSPTGLIAAFAITATLFTLLNLVWNAISVDTKRDIKSQLGFEKSYYHRNTFFQQGLKINAVDDAPSQDVSTAIDSPVPTLAYG